MRTINQIQGIKLTTGDELVAYVVEQTEDGNLCIQNPLMLVMNMAPKTKDSEGGLVCNFYPWTIINEGDIWLRSAGIMANYSVPKDVEQSYTQNTSGLQIVSGAEAKMILQG